MTDTVDGKCWIRLVVVVVDISRVRKTVVTAGKRIDKTSNYAD